MKFICTLLLALATAAAMAAAGDPLQLGIKQVKDHDYQGAVKSLSIALQTQPNNPNALLYRGYAYFYLHQLDEAKSDFLQAIKLAPDVSQGYFNYGLVLDEQGQYERAISQYEETIRLAPMDASAYYNMGNSNSKLGRNSEAARCFEEALRLNPNHPYAAKNLSIVKLRIQGER